MTPAQDERTALVINPSSSESWGLLGSQFGLREKAAATTIGKICGSIITRPQYTSLFDAAQDGFNLTTENLPIWLQGLHFVRSITVLGENMRRIKLDRTMEDVNKCKLSGLATFVVLCSKYGEDTPNITRMINLLLIGGLGTVIRPPDPDHRSDLPYTFKPHVNAFIASCLDADRESDISRQTISKLAELHIYGEIARVDEEDGLGRRRQASVDLMGELLGDPSPEQTMSKNVRELFQLPENKEGWARIHNTLHLMSAYMAIASAAHGANVVVECITPQGSKFIPEYPKSFVRHKYFLVRFWLIQPPQDVAGIMRYLTSKTTSVWQDREEDRYGQDADHRALTIFGGQLEVAICFARELGFQPQSDVVEEHEELLALWSKAAGCASQYRWRVSKPSSKQSPLRLSLQRPKEDTISPTASLLCEHFKFDRRLRSISRTVAALVHDFYKFTDYSCFSREDGESQMAKAMEFVLLVMAIQVLRNTINPGSDSMDSYALNTATLDSQKMGLRNLMAMAISEEGITPYIVVHTAATVWGGLNSSSYRQPRPGEAAVGVVAPHCCVLLDLVRDPLEFARKGTDGYLVSIWRGALPMLPRDPNTNLVCGFADVDSKPFELTSSFQPTEIAYERALGRMLITFEPHVSQPTCGVFCAWYTGHLAAEIHLDNVVSGLLRHTNATTDTRGSHNNRTGRANKPKQIITLSKGDLLHVKQFMVQDGLGVIINKMDDPAWLIFSAGCSARVPDIIIREYTDEPTNLDEMKEELCAGVRR